MTSYLFTWNPARWDWTYLQESIAEVKNNGYCRERWSCGVTKRIKSGDRAFLIKLGKEPRGILASGWVSSEVYPDKHWNKQSKSRDALYVNVDWDTILDPQVSIFPRDWLSSGVFLKMHWEPQASGTRIPEDVSDQLEKDWAKLLERPAIIRDMPLAEEIDTTKTYMEGFARHVTVNVYERSVEARTMCINHYGMDCSVCGFNFGKMFGGLGQGFIHVHHLKSISDIGKGYKLNPVKDMRPVCPNCHSMLHQRKPAYGIEELKTILKQNK
jgi:5-methylcytosine-specific restriction protein A